MTAEPIVSQLRLLPETDPPLKTLKNKLNPHFFWRHPEAQPACVANTPDLQRYLELLGPIHWEAFPDRDFTRPWRYAAVPFQAFTAAMLVKLDIGLHSMQDLRTYLVEHPGFISALGFPLTPAFHHPLGFNAQASLPTARHLTQMLRRLPRAALDWLLAETVTLLLAELAIVGVTEITCVSVDTKHILAWVKENNPKTYVADRFNKDQQPKGDPDCRLGCKRRHNQITPTQEGQPASTVTVGEYYWGYGSGIVVTKIPNYGEFVIAELTQPFDQPDVSYFFPLMQQIENHLGYRPRFGTFDAAFDAWYVYAYFYRDSDPAHGMAAVPFSEKGGYKIKGRQFAPDGAPLCAASLPMALKCTFTDRTKAIVEHERAKYGCPLLFPQPGKRKCPIHHPQWKKGGCTADMPTSIGARLRYTLDRDSELYQDCYRQRTAVERINSQAFNLGIERPHLRNGDAIANQNTLIYTLINLRFLKRLRQRLPEAD